MNSSNLHSVLPENLCVPIDLDGARLGERPAVQRRLTDLRSSFVDTAAVEATLALENPILYEVTSVEAADGDGQMHYGLGVLYPGKVGQEYFLTKGHYHSHRPAAEVYIGLRGEGGMLLEDEETGESRFVALRQNSVVYVPGHTAHRTINTGPEPLVYLGVYPANAGHDYGALAEQNFRQVVIERNGQPVVLNREDWGK